jgi:hypothetical protein
MRRLATLLLCTAALVAGCGSDDDEQATPAATATPSAESDRGGYGY